MLQARQTNNNIIATLHNFSKNYWQVKTWSVASQPGWKPNRVFSSWGSVM